MKSQNITKAQNCTKEDKKDTRDSTGIDAANTTTNTSHIGYAFRFKHTALIISNNNYTVLKDSFKVKYGYISKNYFSALIDQIRVDSRFTILAEDAFGVIFKII